MNFPKGAKLSQIFIDSISDYPEFLIENNGNPLSLKFNNQGYMVFFKCISYAGNPYPENTTRAQLPMRKEFDLLPPRYRFLFLGYDVENDLYVCWDPNKTRSRLNQKSYVSFFCRKNLQDSCTAGEIKEGRLTNGDKFVLFKRSDIPSFFEMIELHFPSLAEEEKVEMPKLSYQIEDQPQAGILEDVVQDKSIELLIDSLCAKGKTEKLRIVSECMNNYGSYYYNMKFIDWANIIQHYLESKKQ